jgi:hypothetical protein
LADAAAQRYRLELAQQQDSQRCTSQAQWAAIVSKSVADNSIHSLLASLLACVAAPKHLPERAR